MAAAANSYLVITNVSGDLTHGQVNGRSGGSTSGVIFANGQNSTAIIDKLSGDWTMNGGPITMAQGNGSVAKIYNRSGAFVSHKKLTMGNNSNAVAEFYNCGGSFTLNNYGEFANNASSRAYVEISGGSLTITSEGGNGIVAGDTVEIDQALVTIDAYDNGIYAKGEDNDIAVLLSNATVNIKATDRGIYTTKDDGCVSVTGCILPYDGYDSAIYTKEKKAHISISDSILKLKKSRRYGIKKASIPANSNEGVPVCSNNANA